MLVSRLRQRLAIPTVLVRAMGMLAALVLLLILVVGCGGQSSTTDSKTDKAKAEKSTDKAEKQPTTKADKAEKQPTTKADKTPSSTQPPETAAPTTPTTPTPPPPPSASLEKGDQTSSQSKSKSQANNAAKEQTTQQQASATASDTQIAQAIDAYLPTLTRGYPGTWDRNRVNIRQNSDHTYTVTTVASQKGAGGGYVILHVVQAKDGTWYVDKTLTDAQAGIDPTKQEYRRIQG